MNLLKALAPLMLVTTAIAPMMSFAGEKVDKRLPADGVSYVHIENQRGEVNVVGWDESEVHVVGELDDKAKRFVFEKEGNGIHIKVEMPRNSNSGWNSQGSDITIHIPIGTKVDFSGVSSNLSIKKTNSSAEVSTVSGDIDAADLSDNIELSTVSGNIDAQELNGRVILTAVSGDIKDKGSKGRLKIKAISGNVISQSSASEVAINTVSGDADLRLKEVDELSISTVSGDVDGKLSLNSDGVLKMSSVSGNFDMVFQKDIQASFRLNSNAGGDFDNEITNDRTQRAKYGPSAKLNFDVGNASASVRGSTVSGTIRLSSR